MQPWNELKASEDKSAKESLIVLCVETIHESKTMDTESEDAVYRNLCARVGANIEGNKAPGESETDEGTTGEGDE